MLLRGASVSSRNAPRPSSRSGNSVSASGHRGAASHQPSSVQRQQGSAARSPSSATGTIYTAVKNDRASRAEIETRRELEKHLASLMAMKQNIRRATDDLSKEYNRLNVSVVETEELLRAIVRAVEEFAASDIGRDFAAQDQQPQQQSAGGSFLTNMATQQKALAKVIAEGKGMLDALVMTKRKLEHLGSLVDRATDIDIQCIHNDIGDTVVSSGSPLFPDMTLASTDEVIQEAVNQCATAGRLSTTLRRLAANSASQAKHCSEHLTSGMELSARLTKEKVATMQRQLEGNQWEEARVRTKTEQLGADVVKWKDRLALVKKTLVLRDAAVGMFYGSTGRPSGADDPVGAALRREEQELAGRIGEFAARMGKLHSHLATLLHEQQHIKDAIGAATDQNRAYSQIARANSARTGSGGNRVGSTGRMRR